MMDRAMLTFSLFSTILLANLHGSDSFFVSLHSTLKNNQPKIIRRSRPRLQAVKGTHECKFCSTSFASRNALFRHIYADPDCSRLANPTNTQHDVLMEPMRYTLALQFSYWSTLSAFETSTYSNESSTIEAEVCGTRLKESVRMAMDSIVSTELQTLEDNKTAEILSSTQVSLSKLRPRSLAQESNSYAAGDVVVVSLQAPMGLIVRQLDTLLESEQRQKDFLHKLLHRTNQIMTTEQQKINRNESGSNHQNSIMIRLEACKLLPRDTKFHAERSCTQRIFHYLMPLRWLPNGNELERWWIENEIVVDDDDDNNQHSNRAATRPPASLQTFKQALRSAQSPTLLDHNETALTKQEANALSMIKVAKGRFGGLSSKRRLPFHNFADPQLKGDASPNNEPVWRTLDRARMVQLIRCNYDNAGDHDANTDDQVVAVLEFRGDEFLLEQVRRVVATAVAVSHGWLPEDMFDVALRADVFLETPVAPMGRMYLSESRFHFDELATGGRSIFTSHKGGFCAFLNTTSNESAISNLQRTILGNCRMKEVQEMETKWLEDLKDTVAPRIRQQIGKTLFTSPVPVEGQKGVATLQGIEHYQRTVHLLRDIVSNKQWPGTSVARSNVIRNVAHSKGESHTNGSFTVVNPDFRGGLYKNGIGDNPLPLANEKFPELAKAVFELEMSLVQKDAESAFYPRPGSSHCAVNCNAQFTPHVDSGRGAGQSLSMIVGLGDYSGGELAVEGEFYDIRYAPLEFDGWKYRHWTMPFSGERFSLVWFTPEVKVD